MTNRFTRLAPGGSAISLRTFRAVLSDHGAEQTLRQELHDRFAGMTLTLHASGRDALRVAFSHLAASKDRAEIAIPAYSCFSIPAAAVAAGMRVRLVDIDINGQLSTTSLTRMPLNQVAAVVVANLFGVPDAIEGVTRLAHDAGADVIDDAAQTLGAQSSAGPVGGRADLGVLSFGRGKPVSALGGGALLWTDPPSGSVVSDDAQEPARWGALLRATVYDAARNPLALRLLSSIPALGIGTTTYDPSFTQGPISGSALVLAAALLPELDALNRSRAQRAEGLAARLESETDFIPIVATNGNLGIYPRLGVVAPSRAKRDAALASLTSFGATAMYPSPLDEIAALRPHLVGRTDCPGARLFCARLLTLPTHAGLTQRRVDELVQCLQRS